MSLPKLEICGITVAFQGDVVLNNLSFEVRDGEFLSVLGPSGCGKTTLLRAIAGLTGLQAGSIRKDGEEITNLSPDRRGIGIVFQNYALFENMTVIENVMNPQVDILKASRQQAYDKAVKLLTRQLQGRLKGEIKNGEADIGLPDYGSSLEIWHHKGGIPTAAPYKLTLILLCLPPILYM